MSTQILHTFGDSHSRFAWDKINLEGLHIKINHIGPYLMYTFGQKKKDLLDISQYGVNDNDIVCFSFGEIDCRCHVHKFVEKGYQNVINEMVDDYINAIQINCSRYNKLKICIYNILPPARKTIYNNNPSFPFLGTDEERLTYIKYMNQQLNKVCLEKGYIFVNVYQQYSNSDDFLNANLSDGGVHIAEPNFLKQFIIKNMLDKYFLTFSSCGLGNIILPLLSGLIICSETKRKLILSYSPNNHGNIEINKLISSIDTDNRIQVVSDVKTVAYLCKDRQICYYRDAGFSDELHSKCTDFITKTFDRYDIIYDTNHDLIPTNKSEFLIAYTMGNWISNGKNATSFAYDANQIVNKANIKKYFKTLCLNSDVQIQVKKFIDDNNINHNTFGIHFRLTDVKNEQYASDVKRIKDIVKLLISLDSKLKFFICSDEIDVENDFIQTFGSNIIKRYSKNNYPTLKNGIIDRSEKVMLDALTDLMILSSTTIIPQLSNIYGTFNSLARALSNESKYLTGPLSKVSILPDLTIDNQILHEIGFCYTMEIPKYSLISDKSTNINQSKLTLYENNVPFEQAHCVHDDIRKKGAGRYSHWNGALYFSTSDNTDPRKNGKTYKIVIYG